ncbi:hypothetical protein H5410_027512 [Solanum commersonii]|uniref:Uncharacterized protein n=1 Tax=Solanum commersonii TaxID=4109 RepID=A0A9J5Z3K5_SOLCO|nr:hypothetical protein H5410_027512 [Solanum commersonii]
MKPKGIDGARTSDGACERCLRGMRTQWCMAAATAAVRCCDKSPAQPSCLVAIVEFGTLNKPPGDKPRGR